MLLKGFTGRYYAGIPMWSRNDYEREHNGMNEKERLEEFLGIYFQSWSSCLDYAYRNYPEQVYRKYSPEHDDRLRSGNSALWESVPHGWVHRITGEFVNTSLHPEDSYPFWCTREPRPMMYRSEQAAHEMSALSGLVVVGLMSIIGLFDNN